jgi:hypothetical protein
VPRDAHELLEAARDELYQCRVLTRQLRNQTKTLAAAYFDSEQRVEALIDEIEARLNGSPRPKEAQGHAREEDLTEARH